MPGFCVVDVRHLHRSFQAGVAEEVSFGGESRPQLAVVGGGRGKRTSVRLHLTDGYYTWVLFVYTAVANGDCLSVVRVVVQNSPCDPCAVHCCFMHWCALCQEHREMQSRLSDDVVMPMTVINPPAPQEMKKAEDQHNASYDHAEIHAV